MAEIKIRRKRRMAWWPALLLLLIPLAWYLVQVRERGMDTPEITRDTGTVPAPVPLPPAAQTPPPELPSPVRPAKGATGVTTTTVPGTPGKRHTTSRGGASTAPRPDAHVRP